MAFSTGPWAFVPLVVDVPWACLEALFQQPVLKLPKIGNGPSGGGACRSGYCVSTVPRASQIPSPPAGACATRVRVSKTGQRPP
eukprot:8002308-Lingulodinium_polyedra.AAC.1